MKLKVAIIIPTLTIGGAEKVALQTADDLNESGVDVTLIIPRGIVDLDIPKGVNLVISHRNSFLSQIQFVIREIFRLKPDVSISYLERANLINLVVGKISGRTRVYLTVHTAPKYGFARRGIINKIMIKLTYKLAARFKFNVITVTRGIALELEQLFGIKNILVVPNYIDSKKVQKHSESLDDSKNSYISKVNENKINLMFVGRLEKIKGCDLIIKSIGGMGSKDKERFNLNIIGFGTEYENLIQLSKDLKVNCNFFGMLDNPYKIMKDSDCVIVPSYAEGFGMVILEAISLGKKIIYSRCDYGPREIFENNFVNYECESFVSPSIDCNKSILELRDILIKFNYDPISEVKKNEYLSELNYFYSRERCLGEYIKEFNIG